MNKALTDGVFIFFLEFLNKKYSVSPVGFYNICRHTVPSDVFILKFLMHVSFTVYILFQKIIFLNVSRYITFSFLMHCLHLHSSPCVLTSEQLRLTD